MTSEELLGSLIRYLTAETWKHDTAAFLIELTRARQLGLHLLLVHEVPRVSDCICCLCTRCPVTLIASLMSSLMAC